MQAQIQQLVDAIVADYSKWETRSIKINGFTNVNAEERIKEFRDEVTVRPGQKYIKIITGNSVWGFVVNTENDSKFAKGDILKAAGWKAPARNKARGNILDGDYSIAWTGPHYL